MGSPESSWDDATETRHEERDRPARTTYVVHLDCDPGEDGTPTPEEIASVLLEIATVRHVHIVFDIRRIDFTARGSIDAGR